MKRIALFLATNLAVMIVFSIVLNIVYAVTGIQQGSLSGLLVMAVLIGMPTVAIYDSPDMNAFATGAKRDDSLVAVSTGLLHSMTRDEAEAVLAHEVSHIANGDMITMTLMQGVVNTFVIFLSRMIANAVSGFTSNDEEGEGEGGSFMTYFIVSTILEIAFGFLASFLTMWFSRHREFHADAGAAQLVGKEKMIAALERLRTGQESQLEGSMMAFGINGKHTLM